MKINWTKFQKNIRSKIHYLDKQFTIVEWLTVLILAILISIGFFIYVSFKAKEQPESPQKDYVSDKLANDFVLSILNVNVAQCGDYSVETLIKDCARMRSIRCDGGVEIGRAHV